MNDRMIRLKEMLKSNPNDAFMLFALAKEYEKTGNKKEALQQYLNLKLTHPEYVGLYYHLAGLYASLDKKDEAFQTYDEGIDCAKKVGDQHALSELLTARMNLEIDE